MLSSTYSGTFLLTLEYSKCEGDYKSQSLSCLFLSRTETLMRYMPARMKRYLVLFKAEEIGYSSTVSELRLLHDTIWG